MPAPVRPVSLQLTGAALALALLSACTASHGPQFPPDVAASFARDRMRKLETTSTEIYYPEQYRASALRLAARVERCVETLRGKPKRKVKRPRALIYLTSADFNNAYVSPNVAGGRLHMVVPQHFSIELFNWFGFGHHEVGDVGCHEAVHYVQNEQVSGFWEALNFITGGILPPNIFTESWFLEGLATYYEGRLERTVGRPHSPFWKAGFESALAARNGNLMAGDLSPENRDFIPFGGNYLIGSHFVDYLARRYGEAKLWKLVAEQGDSIFSPFGVTLRFKGVYGKTIGQLFWEFEQQARKNFKPRTRPEGQQVLDENIGYLGRLAAASDGTLALITAGRDDVVRLTVRGPDGKVRFSDRTVQLLPPRPYLAMHPISVSGMTFTGDGRWLYLALADVSPIGDTETLLLKIDASNGRVAHVWNDLKGIGGGVHPNGTRYVYVRQGDEGPALAELELESGKSRDLAKFAITESLGPPAYSPDGRRIAFSRRSDAGFDLFIREEDGAIGRFTTDGRFNYAPRWVDARYLIFSREHEGRGQIAVADTFSGRFLVHSDVPYLALDPVPVGREKIAFLNRDGFDFSLDSVALPTLEPEDAPAPAAEAMASAPVEVQPAVRQDEQVQVASDKPYSPLDHLFVPTLHAPFFIALPLETGSLYYLATLSLQGADRLSFHNWALNLAWNSLAEEPSFSFGYGNYQLAPWFLQVGASRISDAFDVNQTVRQIDFSAFAAASRSFWDIPFSLFAEARDQSFYGFRDGQLLVRRRFVGAGGSLDYFAGEGTAYGGTKRAIGGSLAATVYPRQLGSDDGMADLRAELAGYVPLPLSSRHNLRLSARARYLPGSEAEVLQVGGLSTLGVIAQLGAQTPFPAPDHLLTFTEPLRGYEDRGYTARGALIATARYRYPLIIDRGITAVLYLLPSFFVRQLELELFGEYARLDHGLNLGSAGGSISLRTTLGGILPISFSYQVAARLRHHPVHYWAISLE